MFNSFINAYPQRVRICMPVQAIEDNKIEYKQKAKIKSNYQSNVKSFSCLAAEEN